MNSQDTTEWAGNAAPSQPLHNEGVWPPPPTMQYRPLAQFPFKYLAVSVKGSICDYREGAISLDSQGVLIDGKAVPRAEIRVPAQILSFLLLRVIGLIICEVVFRYAMIKPLVSRVPWQDVSQVVLNPKIRHVAVVYIAPNKAGVRKTQSLAFRLPADQYAVFQKIAEDHIPGRVGKGKIGSVIGVVMIIIILAAVLGLSLIGYLSSLGH